ncbi:MAG: hypothetical protein AB7P18_31895 [Candidatus Binatia bacterium]
MFFLSKAWQDHEEGIEAVTLHWTTAVQKEEPRWHRAQHVVMVPQSSTSPTLRAGDAWISLPFPQRRLWATNPEDRITQFFLYFFFEVVQRGRRWSTETERQEIRVITVTHSDFSVEATEAFLYYSFDNLVHVHRAPMLLDGLPMRYQALSPLPSGAVNTEYPKRQARRYKLIATIPPPHTFRGHLWGPAGARVLYTVHFSRQGALNPFSEGGNWLLNNGRFWEVRL